MRRHSVASPGTASRLPRQFLEIRPSQIEEKNTRSPTLDCSRSTSSTFELVTFWTAIVTEGRLSACAMAKRGKRSVLAAAPPDFRIVRRVSLLMTGTPALVDAVIRRDQARRDELRRRERRRDCEVRGSAGGWNSAGPARGTRRPTGYCLRPAPSAGRQSRRCPAGGHAPACRRPFRHSSRPAARRWRY